jgi:hypothetical protein
MEIRVIDLIAAMPEEIMPLLDRAGTYNRETLNGFDPCMFILGAREIRQIRSGMGVKNAATATRALISEFGKCPLPSKKTMDNAAIATTGKEFAVGGK